MRILNIEKSQLNWHLFLILILFSKALFFFLVIQFAGIELGPDEAQYWTWSQALDWGYYSKPPGIAWQIWLGTQGFGQSEWGVRSISVLLSFIQGLLIYRLALSVNFSPREAFWGSLLMVLSPLGMAGSLFAITDVGFLLCWTGACLTVTTALQHKREPNPLHIAGWIIVGALFKWPIYLFWLFFFLAHIWFFSHQRKGKIFLGILISLVGLLPSLWWNASHDWATFRHVSATLQGGSGHRATGNFGEFLGSQALLISPVLFILLGMALWQWFRQKKQLTPPLFFCGFVTFAGLTFAIFVSFFQKVQGNWITFAYPTAFIILVWDIFQIHPKRVFWAKSGMAFSLVLTSLLMAIPTLTRNPQSTSYAPPFHLNPFKHNMGWETLPDILTKHGYNPEQHFLLSDKYQTTSLLSFYGPGRKRAYFLNLHGIRNNQFSYWPSLQEEQQNQTGFFVWIENATRLDRDWQDKRDFYLNELAHYFEKVEFVELSPMVYLGPDLVKGALIFRCQNCKGAPILRSKLY